MKTRTYFSGLFLLLISFLFSISNQAVIAQPVNNLPCGAISMECGAPITTSSTLATDSEVDNPECAFGSREDLFYSFTAYPGYSYSVTVNGLDYDGVLILYTGTCSNLQTFGCVDAGLEDNIAETIEFDYGANEAPQTFFIRTYDYNAGGGGFSLMINCSAPNDNPCDAIQIDCNSTTLGASGGATNSELGNFSCTSPTINDVFFKFNAEASFNYTVTVNGDNYDGVLALYSGACGSLTEISCADESLVSGGAETLTYEGTVNETIYIRTTDYYFEGGEFEINLSCSPLNEEICNALPITCGETLYGSTTSASASGLEDPICADALEKGDVFYSFDAEAGIQYTVTANGDNYDAILVAYSGACDGTLTELACADNGLSSGIEETITFSLEESSTVLIRTLDWSSNGGEFEINLTCAPSNNEPCGAVVLECGNTYSGTTVGATNTLLTGVGTCNMTDHPGVFYSFTSLPGYYWELTVEGGPNFDPSISGTLLNTTCDDESGFSYSTCSTSEIGDGTSEQTSGLGELNIFNVYFEIYDRLGREGDFEITFTCTPTYDCPSLLKNFGAPCDDGNPETFNDIITTDCDCSGAPLLPTVASLLTLPCGGQVIQITGAQAASTGGGLATSDTRTIYSFAPDGNESTPSYSGAIWPYVIAGASLEVAPEISAVISFNIMGHILVNGKPAYQYLGDTAPADATGPGGAWSYFLPNGDESQDACLVIYDCPSLDANIGDPCDDLNPDTENDTVNADCVCQGIYPAPANDLCSNAEELAVNSPGDCPANQVIGTTNGAADETGEYSCDTGDFSWADVFYTFNSGPYNTVLIETELFTQTDIVVSIGELCDGENIDCGIGGIIDPVSVEPNTDYIIRTGPNFTFGDAGTFGICITGFYDCPIMEANIGDPCNDGDPSTINDEVQADCTCVGELTGEATFSGTTDWGAGCTFRPMAIDLYEAGTDTYIATISFNINSAGTFSIPMDFLGTFDVYIKIDGYLRKAFYNYVMAPGENNINVGALTPGDLNGDDGINIVDFSILSGAFGSEVGNPAYDLLSDMNCDGGVNIVDFSMLSASFGMEGVALP